MSLQLPEGLGLDPSGLSSAIVSLIFLRKGDELVIRRARFLVRREWGRDILKVISEHSKDDPQHMPRKNDLKLIALPGELGIF